MPTRKDTSSPEKSFMCAHASSYIQMFCTSRSAPPPHQNETNVETHLRTLQFIRLPMLNISLAAAHAVATTSITPSGVGSLAQPAVLALGLVAGARVVALVHHPPARARRQPLLPRGGVGRSLLLAAVPLALAIGSAFPLLALARDVGHSLEGALPERGTPLLQVLVPAAQLRRPTRHARAESGEPSR